MGELRSVSFLGESGPLSELVGRCRRGDARRGSGGIGVDGSIQSVMAWDD
jgi:hypothetical protein